MLLNDILLDDQAIVEGAWVDYRRPGSTNGACLRLRLRRSGPAYQQAYLRAIQPITDGVREGTATDLEIQCATAPVLARWVTGWDLEELDEDGSQRAVPYTEERCAEILSRPGAAHLHEWIQVQLRADENFATQVRKDAEGNSGGTSDGAPPTP